jgi:hypothetical protein
MLPVQTMPQGAGYQQPVMTGTDEDLLYGPDDSGRPDTTPYDTSPAAPPQIRKWLPAFQSAADDPNAPAFFKTMFQAALFHLNQG